MGNLSEQEIVRRNKLEKYKELGIDPFGQAFDVKNKSTEIKEKYNGYTHEQLTPDFLRLTQMHYLILISDGQMTYHLHHKKHKIREQVP